MGGRLVFFRRPARAAGPRPTTGKTAERGYDAPWQAISREVREEHPWCVRCGARQGELRPNRRGELRPVQLTVNHKVALSEGGTHDRSNLEVLCSSCHGVLTAGSGWRQ